MIESYTISVKYPGSKIHDSSLGNGENENNIKDKGILSLNVTKGQETRQLSTNNLLNQTDIYQKECITMIRALCLMIQTLTTLPGMYKMRARNNHNNNL